MGIDNIINDRNETENNQDLTAMEMEVFEKYLEFKLKTANSYTCSDCYSCIDYGCDAPDYGCVDCRSCSSDD